MTAEVEDPTKYFEDRELDVRIEEHDLHAELMASAEPGRASFFAEGRGGERQLGVFEVISFVGKRGLSLG